MDEDDDIPDDKLLDMPTGDAPASPVRAQLLYERQMSELHAELNGTASPRMLMPWSTPREKALLEEKHRREQLAVEEQLREVARRQDQVLQQIELEQAAIEERRREIDDNAIRLRDGRRVYVDGDKYRDEAGRVLTGTDEAEANRQHEYRPDASTWADKKEIERRAAEAEALRQKVLREKEAGEGTPAQQAAQVTADEKDFADKVQARQDTLDKPTSTPAAATAAGSTVPDYGGNDYMSELQLSSGRPSIRRRARRIQPTPPSRKTATVIPSLWTPKNRPSLSARAMSSSDNLSDKSETISMTHSLPKEHYR